MFGLGLMEIGIIVLILLVLFGAKRIPVLMGSIGQGIKEFQKSFRSDEVGPGSSADENAPGRRDLPPR